MSYTKIVSSLIACILFILFVALFATPVLAHDGVDHETDAEAQAHVRADITLPMKPLDLIKARAQQIKNGAQNAKIDLRANTKIELQNAPPGERKGVIQNTVGAHVDIAKGRQASSTDLKRDLKNLVRMHGGEIKNRFRLAISHMNNLLMRIDMRLNKMAAAGVDTASVGKLKVDAELAVDKAEVDAQAVADFVAGVNESSDRAAVKAELRAKIKTAHDSLKAARAAVMKVVRALVQLAKDNRVKVDASATTSTSVQ